MCSKKRGGVWLLLAVCAMTAFKPADGYHNISGMYPIWYGMYPVKHGINPVIHGMYPIQNGVKDSYRFFHNSYYKIIDTAGFYLYYRYIQFEQNRGKGLVKKDEYYFSKDGSSDIKPLTIENLKRAYPENHRFHYDIDAHFRSDRELMAYDSYTQSYKLKYLYMQSLKD
jgi:hypothetical protein